MSIAIDNFNPSTKEKQFKDNLSEEWMEFDEEPLIYSVIGSRSSGKSGMSDYMLKKYYDRYFTCLHLYSGRSLENLYFIVNKNCDIHFKKIKQLLKNKFGVGSVPEALSEDDEKKYVSIAERGGFIKKTNTELIITEKGIRLLKGQLLHCKCNKAIPMILLVPDYNTFDMETVDRFNGYYWKDMEEYKQHMSEITKEDKELLLQGKLFKPTYLRPEPMIRVRHFPVPKVNAKNEKFIEIWTESVLTAREEHRVLVMSPLFFEGEDKFETLGVIAKYHPTLMNLSGHFEKLTEKDVGKPYRYWTKREKNWHKMAVFIDEARSVIPSSKMHGESGAGKSKKAIFDNVPEMRHFKTWLHLFYQNPADVYDGVRHNDSMTIMKRTHLGLAGDYWKWIFNKVLRDRWGFMKLRAPNVNRYDDEKNIEIIKQRAHAVERRYPKLKKWIDDRRPSIEDMDGDKAYVIRYGKMRLIKNEMGSWHHKQETESITGDTGIKWSIDRNKRTIDDVKTESSNKKETKEKKQQMERIVFDRMTYLKEKEGKEWLSILDDMIQLERDGVVYGFDFEKRKDSKEPNKWISGKYTRLKEKLESKNG